MGERFSYKLIGLIVAVALYIAILGLLYYAVFEDASKKKDYGYNVEDAIVVDIDTLIKEKPKPVQKPKPKPKAVQMPVRAMPITPPSPPAPKPLPKEPPKRVEKVPAVAEQTQPKKESRAKMAKSAKDLFSTVRTDKYKKAEEEKQKQREARASRLKKQQAEVARKKRLAKKKAQERAKRRAEKKRQAQKLLQELDMAQSSSKHRKKGEEHKFWSFVSDKIMGKWNRTVATQDGLKGYATIRIDNRGRLTYKNLKLSGNSLFDTKLKVFLDNLEYERFPAYKEGPYIEAVFEFKDQAKGR